MYEEQFIEPDKTGLALVDGRGVNEGVKTSLLILPDEADADETIKQIRASDLRYTLSRTISILSMLVAFSLLVLRWMMGISFFSHSAVIATATALVISALLYWWARRKQPAGLLRADISLRDILTPEDVETLRRAKASDRKEDYLDAQELIAVKHRRNLGINPEISL